MTVRAVPDTGYLGGILSFLFLVGKSRDAPSSRGLTRQDKQQRALFRRRGNPGAHVTDCGTMQTRFANIGKKKKLTKCSWRRTEVALKPLKIPVRENTRLRLELPSTTPEEAQKHCESLHRLLKPDRLQGKGNSQPKQRLTF